MAIGSPSPTENEECVCLWALLMVHAGQLHDGMKLLNYSIKNSFGFTPLT